MKTTFKSIQILRISHVTMDEMRASYRKRMQRSLRSPAPEVVEQDHLVILRLKERSRKRSANKTRTSGYQNTHVDMPFKTCAPTNCSSCPKIRNSITNILTFHWMRSALYCSAINPRSRSDCTACVEDRTSSTATSEAQAHCPVPPTTPTPIMY